MSHGQSPYHIPPADPNKDDAQASREYLAAKEASPQQHNATRKLVNAPPVPATDTP
jgi:hypothetical protein